jgi:hypothetical protein
VYQTLIAGFYFIPIMDAVEEGVVAEASLLRVHDDGDNNDGDDASGDGAAVARLKHWLLSIRQALMLPREFLGIS